MSGLAWKWRAAEERALSRKLLESSTIFLKASSSYQHSFVVRHSSCTTDVTTKFSSAGPRLRVNGQDQVGGIVKHAVTLRAATQPRVKSMRKHARDILREGAQGGTGKAGIVQRKATDLSKKLRK